MGKYIFLFMMLIVWVDGEIVAYDCADKTTELTKVSLLAVKPCQDPRNFTENNFRRIQLIQKRQYVPVHVYTCQVKVEQMIEHCGMHSHRSTVAGGFGKFIQHIDQEQCMKAHRFRQLDLSRIGAGVISKLVRNGTTEISVTLQGFADTQGKCEGVRFAVGPTQYTNVVVIAALSIRLHDYVTVADVERNTVSLHSGTICPYNDGYCFDDIEGEVTWQQHLSSLCSTSGVDVLYEGNATLLTISRNPPNKYILVETEDTVFALKLTKPEELCAQKAWQTEQNRLLIIFEDSVGFYYHRTIRLPQNTDLMAQVLSKLLYLEIAVKRQMADVIYDSIMKRCQLREKILQNRLALAKQSPDAVGNLVKETSGYVSRVMGEVLYIAKCRPIVVEYRRTTECFQELPVRYQNRSLFRTAITHILVEHGTKVECQPLLPVNFKLENNWIEVTPELKRTTAAIELDANDEEDKLSMRGISISPISSNGIYTQDDMDNFQQTLLYPNTRKAVTNQVTRRIVGMDSSDPYYMPNLFSKHEFTNIAHSAAEEVWGFLSKMGNIFSICGFIYTIACAVSYLAGVITNYFTLKKASRDHPNRKRYLLASLWNNLAHTYLYQLHRRNQERAEEPVREQEMKQIEMDSSVPQQKVYPVLLEEDSKCADPNCRHKRQAEL